MDETSQHNNELAGSFRLFKQLSPSKVAVVLIDFQNDFCAKPENTKKNAEAAQRANEFAQNASELGAHVVYSQQILDLIKLTDRQKRWEKPNGLCAVGSWGAELFLKPVPGSTIVTKNRFDIWQSQEFIKFLEGKQVEGLVICGVELACCVLYAVIGAEERGYNYIVPQDLVSGIDSAEDTSNTAVRDYLRYSHQSPDSANELLEIWQRKQK